MIRELLGLLRVRSALDDMFNEFTQMIEKIEWMFHRSIDVLTGEETGEETAEQLYSKDKEVNEHERNIRRKIITHLSIKPGADVPACMVLMSIVKDAERVGDYCKNILELGTMSNIVLDRGRYKTPVRDLADEVEGLFIATRKAMQSSDKLTARRVIVKGEQINDQCNMLIKQLVADDIPTGKAVVYTLAVRYIKRVSSHLANIATSIVNSIDNLDFSGEPKD